MMRVLADASRGGTPGRPARGVVAVAIEPGVERMRAGSGRRLCAIEAAGPFDNAAE
jgi:hypothetical protein